MVKVITYGTYDLLHYGHIRLLERAKALGDYLIVAVTADDFDVMRGKINVQQSLMERVEAVRSTGLADEIIVEEYEGQKIDDVQKYCIDIFTVGSDWEGKFDYLNEYCKVVYLDRTEGISSSELRSNTRMLSIGIVGESVVIPKFVVESRFVNGVVISGIYSKEALYVNDIEEIKRCDSFEDLLECSDALYIVSHPTLHYEHIKLALKSGKHVLYESPVALKKCQAIELFSLAEKNRCVLYAGIKTAYITAYSRMILLAKSGKIGDIVSVDAVCTSLQNIDYTDKTTLSNIWNSVCAWGPTALLPVFQLLGTDYKVCNVCSRIAENTNNFDEFTKIDFLYSHAVASIKVGKGVKSEGQLIISGTKGYIYVPAPWWKSDYFEIRYEDLSETKRFFYQLEGEGIRNEIVSFLKSIRKNRIDYVSYSISEAIVGVIERCSDDGVLRI